eukprot:TRINITY_DN452_c2_g1_i1.p1 TRINITY_DN452_c2_g1~~TRINITY_DN452_c2_g1_i1.p1  ORF type:complete len:796 (-),score=179.23 TRINITY_DN452_c2_g1_i1:1606-3954(-)
MRRTTTLVAALLLLAVVAASAAVGPVAKSTGTPLLVKPATPYAGAGLSRLENLDAFLREYYGAVEVAMPGKPLPKIRNPAGQDVDIVYFDQTYKNLLVRGAGVKVVFSGDAIAQASAKLVIDVELDTTPSVTEAVARGTALWVARLKSGANAAMKNDFAVTFSTLVVHRTGLSEGFKGINRLAWDVRVHSDSLLLSYSVVVDAKTGDVIDSTSLTQSALYRELRHWPSSTAYWKEGQALPTNIDETSFLNAAGDYYNTLFNMFAWRSYDNKDAPLIGNMFMNDSFVCPNAYFDPTVNMTFFCTGLSRFDIATHELGHALTMCLDNGIYEYASGALQEAWSDTIAETFSQFWNGSGYYPPRNTSRGCGDPSKRWVCGDDCEVFNNGLRDLYNPTCYGLPDSVSNLFCYPYDEEGVHKNCGPPSVLYAVLADGGQLGNTSYTGIGLLKAFYIFFQAKYQYQKSTDSFEDYAHDLTQGCADMIGKALKDQYGNNATGIAVTQADCDVLSSLIDAVGLTTDPCTDYKFWGSYPRYVPMEGTTITVLTEGKIDTQYMRLGNATLNQKASLWAPSLSTSGWNQQTPFAVPAFAAIGATDASNVPFELASDTAFTTKPALDADWSLPMKLAYFKQATISSLSPSKGDESGGYTVTVTGTDFANFEGPCTSYYRSDTQDCLLCVWKKNDEALYTDFAGFINSTTLTCVAPASSGSWNVSITLNAHDPTNWLPFKFVGAESSSMEPWPTTKNIIVLSVVIGGCLIVIVGAVIGFVVHRYIQKRRNYQQLPQ